MISKIYLINFKIIKLYFKWINYQKDFYVFNIKNKLIELRQFSNVFHMLNLKLKYKKLIH